MRFTTASLFETEREFLCHFGVVSAPLAAFLAADIGLGATAGTIGAGVIEGAGLGALTSEITGGDPLKGALTGGLTGGAVGGASAFGLGAAGTAAVGAGAGAIGAEVTGQSPLTGALTGGAVGLITGSGAFGASPAAGTASVASSPSTGGTGVAASAPASIAPPAGGLAADPTAAAGAATASTGASSVNPDFTNSLLGSKDFGGTIVSQTTTPAPAAGSSNIINSITGGGGDSGGIGGFIQKNPGVALGAGALGLATLMGNKPSSAETQLQTQANNAASMSSALEQYQLTGTLPSGLQSLVDQHQNNAIAGIKSKYAELGMAGSTAETQAVAATKQESATQIAGIADKLAKQGIAWEALSSQDLDNVIRAENSRNATFTSALTTFAAGLAGAKFNTGGGSAG